MSGINLSSGINLAFPDAVIYSSSDSFRTGLKSWGINMFDAFHDSFLYYLFGSVTWQVLGKFFSFFLIMLGVAFFSALLFGGWFGSTSGFESRLKSLFSKKS